MVFIISVACLIVGCIAGFALFRYTSDDKASYGDYKYHIFFVYNE